MIQKRYPELFGFSVSSTTRGPRAGEEDGVHYHFTTVEEVEAGINRDEYLEHARVHANIYGTTFKAVRDVQEKGKICILDIDVQGAQSVKKSSMESKYLFVLPPSLEELEARIRKRGSETEDKIKLRMNNATGEIEFGKGEGNFNAVVTNDDLEATVDKIIECFKEWYPTVDFNSPIV